MKISKVSQRITKIMADREITVQDMSQRTGLDRDFLETITKEDLYPSLGPLLKIARALGVRLGTLIDDQVSQDPLIVRKDAAQESISMLRGADKPEELKFYSLGMGKTDRHMEPFYVEILPESAKDAKLSSHEGEEFIVVNSGRIKVVYGQETHILGAGDSIYYNSITPHYVSCEGEEAASIYAVLYIP
ncbi:transcriptional regulator, XRE family with cupin sensor [Desulfatibacillum alkenivorans DSM 16219]|uniref:Transcriptional regulator, XRE family with cupin sensor n=1 Tax=Desulfatibacillum alkenivorans DSM 16219 TaxID=1121393 RepID=A0A1M6DRI4_9BACT|nr:cupin domain-containing protein [Desulfatibacillum alkenivorans]SHI75847.1 transcriptional regulator, XRE family with cupin sensor [Desulfatibacillum alkenivorans DSM 16219]